MYLAFRDVVHMATARMQVLLREMPTRVPVSGRDLLTGPLGRSVYRTVEEYPLPLSVETSREYLTRWVSCESLLPHRRDESLPQVARFAALLFPPLLHLGPGRPRVLIRDSALMGYAHLLDLAPDLVLTAWQLMRAMYDPAEVDLVFDEAEWPQERPPVACHVVGSSMAQKEAWRVGKEFALIIAFLPGECCADPSDDPTFDWKPEWRIRMSPFGFRRLIRPTHDGFARYADAVSECDPVLSLEAGSVLLYADSCWHLTLRPYDSPPSLGEVARAVRAISETKSVFGPVLSRAALALMVQLFPPEPLCEVIRTVSNDDALMVLVGGVLAELPGYLDALVTLDVMPGSFGVSHRVLELLGNQRSNSPIVAERLLPDAVVERLFVALQSWAPIDIGTIVSSLTIVAESGLNAERDGGDISRGQRLATKVLLELADKFSTRAMSDEAQIGTALQYAAIVLQIGREHVLMIPASLQQRIVQLVQSLPIPEDVRAVVMAEDNDRSLLLQRLASKAEQGDVDALYALGLLARSTNLGKDVLVRLALENPSWFLEQPDAADYLVKLYRTEPIPPETLYDFSYLDTNGNEVPGRGDSDEEPYVKEYRRLKAMFYGLVKVRVPAATQLTFYERRKWAEIARVFSGETT